MSRREIRPVAVGVPIRGDELLLSELYDPTADDRFYRPIGGGIEFGEHSEDALVREFEEELDATVSDAPLLETLERTFEFDGEPGHEIWFLYEVDLAEDWPYERDEFTGYEDAVDDEFPVRWVPREDLAEATVYPEELPELIE